MENVPTQEPGLDKDTQIWNEYQTLRDEIKTADTLNYQIMGAVVAAAAVILTAAFSQSNPPIRMFIFLCVYVVTIPAYRLLQGNRRRTWRISTYLRVFLEPELQYTNWESRLSASRSKKAKQADKQSLSSLIGTNEWFTVTLINTIATVAAGVSLFQSSLPLLARAIGCIGLGAWLLAVYLRTSAQEKDLRRGGKVEMGFEKSWVVLKNEEGGEQPTNTTAGSTTQTAPTISQQPAHP